MMKQRLDQRQVQKLILAPALQQAIKLLPMTNLELIEVIDEELSENPMLELEGESIDRQAEASEDNAPAESAKTEALEAGPEEPAGNDDDAAFESYFQEYFDDGFRPSSQERREIPAMENTLAGETTLWDHLDWQANLTFHEPVERDIAERIIGNINDDGYLTVPPLELAETIGVPVERVEAVRRTIMAFDPVGVAALELKECLLAQMDYLEIKDETARTIVTQHLGLLEKCDYAQLAKLLGRPASAVKYHIEVIKRLDPTPGRKYSKARPSYITPDIIVTKEGDDFKISLNDEGLPRLRINAYYRQLLAKAFKDNPDAYHFLKDKMKKALWFLRSLDQRDQTIFKVARYVVDKQKDFIDKGMDFIRPLTLMEIAQEIGVHESTVGRVVANKFIMTPQGVYSLKYFFHKALIGDAGEDVSSLRVKDRIRKMVEAEDKTAPFSDMEIEAVLGRENFHIARRTVAKYRKQLKILPSHIRKRKYQMEGTP
ncbi:MAG: RNA polymerase factor sigma-54 [Candidatus Aminicenantes bacterium]|nr:RNA polymerase factor sigma-54 [Candidatus Aminicenantes bacterium]